MKHLILLCLLTLTIITSCNKNTNLSYTFTGKVTDINGNPIASATIELNAYYPPASILSNGYAEEVAKVKTDNSGIFNIKFNYENNANNFYIIIQADNYFTYYNYNVFPSEIQNNVLTRNFIIYKLATIKINFKNINPISNTDAFSVFQSNELPGPPFNTFIERQFTGGTYDNLESKYIGSAIQGYVLTYTKGDTYTVINWSSKKNGILNYKIDTVIVPGGTQGNYNINY